MLLKSVEQARRGYGAAVASCAALAALLSWASPLSADPVIHAQPKEYDFGVIVRGERVSRIYHILNRGRRAPLDITLVKTSCGCSATFLEDRRIPPGGSTLLKVRFDSTEFLGNIRKTVFIYSNDPKNPEYSISFTAEVKTLVEVEPDRFNLGTVDLIGGTKKQFPFRVVLSTPEGRVTGLEYNREHFSASCAPPRKAGGKTVYDCRLAVKPGAPSGSILEALLVRTNVRRQPVYKVNIYGRFKGAFDVLPLLVDFGELASSETAVATVKVTSPAGTPFRILEVKPDRPEIAYEVAAAPGNAAYTLTIRFSPATLTEVVEGKLEIRTDHSVNPDIQIKYQAFVE